MEDDEEVESDDDTGYGVDVPLSFAGPCTCEHDADDHGWTGCTIEGCDCDASWEE